MLQSTLPEYNILNPLGTKSTHDISHFVKVHRDFITDLKFILQFSNVEHGDIYISFQNKWAEVLELK